jgi:hypothetical protein
VFLPCSEAFEKDKYPTVHTGSLQIAGFRPCKTGFAKRTRRIVKARRRVFVASHTAATEAPAGVFKTPRRRLFFHS